MAIVTADTNFRNAFFALSVGFLSFLAELNNFFVILSESFFASMVILVPE